MITVDTFPQLLEFLGFSKNRATYTKTIGSASLVVDAAKPYDMLNLAKIRNTKLPLPPLSEQQRLVAEIEALEQTIAAAQAIIAAAPARKQAAMQRYL